MHPSSRPSRWLYSLLLTATLLTPRLHAATVVYSDDFSDGNRAGWYNSASSASLTVVSGRLRAINTNATFLTYFTATSLDVGQSITLTCTLSLDAVADYSGGLRLGIFNSATGTKVTADNLGTDMGLNYEGYRIYTNAGAGSSGNTKVEKRDPANTSYISSAPWSLVGSVGSGVNLTAGSTYALSITYARTAESSLKTTFVMNGVTLETTDTAATNFTFDSLIFNKSSGNGNLFLDDVVVSVVPEPSTAALLFGALLGAVTLARRKRST